MWTTNFTVHSKTMEDFFCSTELSERIHIPLICLSVVNIIFALTATMGNNLIVVALQRETSLHPPSKVLLRNLAVTDLCVGIISQPLQIALFLTLLYKSHQKCRYTNGRGWDRKHHSVWSINVDNNRRQCGQNSCSVVKTLVQTSCNPQTNIWSCDLVLGWLNPHGSHLALGPECMACFGDFFNFIVPCDIHFLLLEDFPHPASLSKSSSRERPGTSESNISTEYNETIQKDSVQWNVRTVGISFVLFAFFVGVAIQISRECDAKKTVGSFLCRNGKHTDFALF